MMTKEPWPVKYIGEAWVQGEHDCWGFARRVWREQFGLTVPHIDADALSALSVARKIRDDEQINSWEKIDTPEDGCGVLMGKSERPCHVGVWADFDGGKVLHCVNGRGVVFTGNQALQLMGYRVLGWYRRKQK
jgi:hypothetical protein